MEKYENMCVFLIWWCIWLNLYIFCLGRMRAGNSIRAEGCFVLCFIMHIIIIIIISARSLANKMWQQTVHFHRTLGLPLKWSWQSIFVFIKTILQFANNCKSLSKMRWKSEWWSTCWTQRLQSVKTGQRAIVIIKVASRYYRNDSVCAFSLNGTARADRKRHGWWLLLINAASLAQINCGQWSAWPHIWSTKINTCFVIDVRGIFVKTIFIKKKWF